MQRRRPATQPHSKTVHILTTRVPDGYEQIPERTDVGDCPRLGTFESAGDLGQLAAVSDSLYRDRMVGNQEFEWLLADIEEYNKRADETSVSLLESVGRERIAESEAKKKAREEQRNGGPLLDEENELAGAIDPALADDSEDDDAADTEEEEDEGPDSLLRESARIVADMVELGSDVEMLKRQFALLSDKGGESLEVN